MNDDDLRARLRAADPAADLPPAAPHEVHRLVADVVSTELTAENRATGTHHRSRLTWLVAAAAIVVIASAVLVGVRALGGDDGGGVAGPAADSPSGPTATTLTAPGGAAAARCAVPDAELLSRAEIAVSATVTATTGGEATLAPDHWYAGDPTEVVRVQVPSEQLQQLLGATDLETGTRYLLAGNDGQLMVCGFSGPYDEQRAALYAAAFG